MPLFDKMYYYLFNAATDAVKKLKKGNTEEAIVILTEAQTQTENMYIEEKDEPD